MEDASISLQSHRTLSSSFSIEEEEGQDSQGQGQQQFSLPRADGGKDAWLFLLSAFVLEALVWGFPFSFGVFETYYTSHPPFSEDASSVAAIGTTATGMMYFTAPLVYAISRRYPQYRRHSTMIGFVILLAALVGASFATTVGQLLATQGVAYAIGGAFHYFPTLAYLDEWFVQRKGIAFGIICAGGGAAGVAIPLVMEWVLNRWGYQTALRAWAVAVFVLTAPTLYFNKGRLPVRRGMDSGPQRIELRFLKTRAFWILQLANIVQGLGYFLPSTYLSSYALSVGLTTLDGTLGIAVINASTVFGAILIGFLSDRYHVTTAILTSSLGTVVAVFLFWSFATSLPLFFVFAIFYGIFGGGYSSTWASCAKPMREQGYPGTETGMIIAIFSAGKGIGAVISGPISAGLVQADKWESSGSAGSMWAYGSGYGSTIVFTGITAAFGGLGWYARRCGLL